MEFADYLWLPFLDQPQSEIAVFEIINFRIYNIVVKKCKHGIGPNDIITFNEELESILTSTIKMVNTDDSSYDKAIENFITKKT